MIGEIADALAVLLTWPTIAFLVIGTIIGLVLGAIPGLGGLLGIVLLIPFTFGMETTVAITLFASTVGGSAFGGSISAILIDVPGTPTNTASVLDGHPMARKGKAGKALGISATASALGAVFGLLVLVVLLPMTVEIVLAFSSPEFFWLAILGISVIAVVSKGDLLKGLVSGGIGSLLA